MGFCYIWMSHWSRYAKWHRPSVAIYHTDSLLASESVHEIEVDDEYTNAKQLQRNRHHLVNASQQNVAFFIETYSHLNYEGVKLLEMWAFYFTKPWLWMVWYTMTSCLHSLQELKWCTSMRIANPWWDIVSPWPPHWNISSYAPANSQ